MLESINLFSLKQTQLYYRTGISCGIVYWGGLILYFPNRLFHLDTPTGTPLGSEEDLAPSPPLNSRTRSALQPSGDDALRIQEDRTELSRRRSNELGNRGPLPDVTIPQGDSSSFGMNTRRSVHMSSVRAKRNEGSVLFF